MQQVLICCGLVMLMGSAHAADQNDTKIKAAQMALLATLAPQSCPGLEADQNAISEFLTHVQVSEGEIYTRYAKETRAVADAFEKSVDRDRDVACAQIWQRLGQNGLGLVIQPDGDEQ